MMNLPAFETQLWHPVCESNFVLESPVPVKLMNTDLVLWRDEDSVVHCLHDQCPHRGAKLSLGTICEGQLQCAYHGWRFDGEGVCQRIPSMTSFKPGPAHQARSVAVKEGMGLVWVCFDSAAATKTELPAFTAEHNPRQRKLNAGPYEVNTSAPRIVDNFLDIAHFSFVHRGWLGDPSSTNIADYQVETLANGFIVKNVKVEQPQASLVMHQSAEVHYQYEVSHPYCAVLTKVHAAEEGEPPAFEESIALFIQPVTAERSRIWFRMAVSDIESESEDLVAFQDKIFSQDKPVLESQTPLELPLHTGSEVHVASDKAAVAYRKYLLQCGVTFGVC
jgi:phenylpropionate dioxygenase-like ring-hydroxylating dioxygenase large terminal subunit